MRQPSLLNSDTSQTPSNPLVPTPQPPPGPERRIPKPPTPEEMIAHYESQGMDHKDASLKAIRELQGVLYRTAISRAREGGGASAGASPRRRMDDVSTRLAILEAKLDSKPGFPGVFAVGVASGAVAPLVLGGLSRVWALVRDVAAGSGGGNRRL